MAFSLTGAGSGFLSGAAAGSQGLGPYGSLIGGAIGGLTGGFSGSDNSAKAIQDQLNLGIMTQASNIEQAREAMKWSEGQAGETRNFNSAQAVQQMNFQERMATTQHQREMADLKAAGLNPILTAMGGSGAAAPQGAAGSASTPGASQAHVGTPYDSYAGDIISAKKLRTVDEARTNIEIARGLADIAKTAKETKVLDTQDRLYNAQEINQTLQGGLAERSAKLQEELAKLPEAQRQKLQSEIDEIKARILNYPKQGKAYEAQAADHLASASLSSAQTLNTQATKKLIDWEYLAKPNAELTSITGGAKNIGDAAGSFTGAISDLIPFKGIKLEEKKWKGSKMNRYPSND